MALSIDERMFQQLSSSSLPADATSPAYVVSDQYNFDINDLDLLNNLFPTGSGSGSSRESTPVHLLTPPQEELLTSFPDVHDEDSAFFASMFQQQPKGVNTTTPVDLGNMQDPFSSFPGYGGYGMGMSMEMSPFCVNMEAMDNSHQGSTPEAISDNGEDDSDDKDSPASPPVQEKEEAQSPVLTSAASRKVGGHGKARKGTVQSGGVTKKSTADKASKKAGPSAVVRQHSRSSDDEEEDEYDDIPHDLRPSPEIYAKMSSKDKRRLRNKISARNFRVRRKAYISTLEGDIEERDRMLDHFRTQLGSREFENSALRQEISALQHALLSGRGVPIELPPPAPLPEQSAADALGYSSNSSSQKDVPAWPPRVGTWSGAKLGAGFSSSPDLSSIVRKGLQENINPALNVSSSSSSTSATPSAFGVNKPTLNSFDGFADLNPFTMKTLDAYRMHLWGKMAAQQQAQNHGGQAHSPQHSQHPSGLASTMRPHFFTGSSKTNLPVTGTALSGKHSSYPTPPTTPHLKGKALPSSSSTTTTKEQEKAQQQAMLAAVATQTVARKLGSAFWDAFTGGSSSSPVSSTASSANAHAHAPGAWDTGKVQRVLEGKAVLRVVDVEPPTPSSASLSKLRPAPAMAKTASKTSVHNNAVCDLLEESMRSLTLNKKT